MLNVNVCLFALVYPSLYTDYSYSPPTLPRGIQNLSPGSDVGALGVIGGGGGWLVAAPLFGVVEAVVLLVGGGGGGGIRRAAGEDGAAQQGENSAHPAGVEGEAERHEAVLLVSADGKPDRGNHTAQRWGDTDRDREGSNKEDRIVQHEHTCGIS